MSDISVSTKNIGGTEKFDVKISTGKVNIVKGSSSSGKSSLMRGIHLGLVGNPNQNQYREEAEKLHLDDTKTDQAILKRGSSEGSVVVQTIILLIFCKFVFAGSSIVNNISNLPYKIIEHNKLV